MNKARIGRPTEILEYSFPPVFRAFNFNKGNEKKGNEIMEKKRKRRRKTPEEKQQERIKRIKSRYGKLKEIEFKPMDKVNLNKHFNIPKKTITGELLSNLAMVVYPVLCSVADFEKNNWFQISQKNIAKLSGITEPSVLKATKELSKTGLLKMKKITKDKRSFYLYKVEFYRDKLMEKPRGGYINLQAQLFETGTWANLSIKAKLYYLALRKNAKFNSEQYAEIELIELHEVNSIPCYKMWEICPIPKTQLCKSVNINYKGINKVIDELENCGLVEEKGFIVHRIPKNLNFSCLV